VAEPAFVQLLEDVDHRRKAGGRPRTGRQGGPTLSAQPAAPT
jgi:hypothetical protein